MSKETSWIALGSPAASRQNCHKLFWVNPNASIYLSKIRMVIKISCILSRKVHWQKVWWKRKWHMQKPVVSFAWWMQGIMWSAAAQAKALGNHSSVPVPGCMDCKSHKPWPCTPSALGNLLLQVDKRSRSQLLRPAFQTSTPSRSAPASALCLPLLMAAQPPQSIHLRWASHLPHSHSFYSLNAERPEGLIIKQGHRW